MSRPHRKRKAHLGRITVGTDIVVVTALPIGISFRKLYARSRDRHILSFRDAYEIATGQKLMPLP